MQCLKPAPHVVSRMIQGRALILHHQQDEIQQLNEVASFIWSCILQASFTVEGIVSEIVQEFEIDHEQAMRDLQDFLHLLEQQDLLRYDG